MDHFVELSLLEKYFFLNKIPLKGVQVDIIMYLFLVAVSTQLLGISNATL